MKAFAFAVPVVLMLATLPCYGQIIPSMVTSSMRVLPAENRNVGRHINWNRAPYRHFWKIPIL